MAFYNDLIAVTCRIKAKIHYLLKHGYINEKFLTIELILESQKLFSQRKTEIYVSNTQKVQILIALFHVSESRTESKTVR